MSTAATSTSGELMSMFERMYNFVKGEVTVATATYSLGNLLTSVAFALLYIAIGAGFGILIYGLSSGAFTS